MVPWSWGPVGGAKSQAVRLPSWHLVARCRVVVVCNARVSASCVVSTWCCEVLGPRRRRQDGQVARGVVAVRLSSWHLVGQCRGWQFKHHARLGELRRFHTVPSVLGSSRRRQVAGGAPLVVALGGPVLCRDGWQFKHHARLGELRRFPHGPVGPGAPSVVPRQPSRRRCASRRGTWWPAVVSWWSVTRASRRAISTRSRRSCGHGGGVKTVKSQAVRLSSWHLASVVVVGESSSARVSASCIVSTLPWS